VDTQRLNEEGRDIWDRKADFWDALHGDDGNQFHQMLVSPGVERLLALKPDERVLDVACGNGTMARRLAMLGGKVTAVDFSTALLAKARNRGQPVGIQIVYKVADATDEAALVTLGEGNFDAVVCTMALMDMPVIRPFYQAARRLLSPGGRLIIATSHPAFNSNNPVIFMERADQAGNLVTTWGVKIARYLDVPATKGAGAPNEPTPHYYYHRPLHELLGEAFAANLVLDGMEESAFVPKDTTLMGSSMWANLPQIPPVFIARLRPGA
jgi:2-polyprenyl-3-methyl-5-hydroxy-6-metoxy-1,4-benzoquinol methylase